MSDKKKEEKQTLWEQLLAPLRKKIYNNLPAREFSPYDRFDCTSTDTYESFDGTNTARIILELQSGQTAKDWLQRAYNIVDFYKDSANKPEDYYDALSYIGHEDAKDKYLQFPQKSNTVVESKYKPTKTKDNTTKYYRFSFWTPEYWDRENDIHNYSHITESIEDFAKNNGKSGNTPSVDIVLNNFIRGYGVDPKKGQYMSIYDIWDYNTNVRGGGKDNIATKIGAKPFEIYDRVYLDDVYGVNSAPEKGTYYGGYVPPVVVTGYKYGEKWKKQ